MMGEQSMMISPVRFPQIDAGHTIDVASSHEFSHAFSICANGKYEVVVSDPRYPSKVEQLGVTFWKGALTQSPLSRAVALSVRADRLAVATVGGRLVAGGRNSPDPCSCKLPGVSRGCMEYMGEGRLLVAATAGSTNELVLMSVDERNGGAIRAVASEPLMHAPTSLSTSTNRVAVSDASNSVSVYSLEESRKGSGELGYALVLTHVIPDCSAVLSVHGDVVLTRENDECGNINVMAMGDQHAVRMACLSGCCHAEASQDRVVSIEDCNGAPALVVYRVEEGASGIVRHAPRQLSSPADKAVSFSVNNIGLRNVITSRASHQLWVM